MKTLIGIIIVIALIGGGYYFFAQPNGQDQAMEQEDAMMEDDSAMKDGDAMMEKEDGEAMENDGAMMDDGSMMEASVKEFTIEGSSFKFVPSTMTVKKGDTVRVTFKNVGGFHDFVIDEFNVATKQTASPDEQTVEFVADQAGSFEYYCSVGNHRAQGMVGTLTVE